MLKIVLFILLVCPALQAREPAIHEIHEQAIRYLGFDRHEIDSWQKRARWAAALPRVQVDVDHDLKDSISLTKNDSVSLSGGDVFLGPAESHFDQNFNQGTTVRVKALWSLDELIFNRDTLAASSEKRDWIRERNRTLREIDEAYFTRKRISWELKHQHDPIEIREKKKMLGDQSLATLDALTGGWYSQEIQK